MLEKSFKKAAAATTLNKLLFPDTDLIYSIVGWTIVFEIFYYIDQPDSDII